jgi:hypothetical protein
MRSRAFAVATLFLGALVLGGCSEGPTIPPSKGGAEARTELEYPFGPPTKGKSRTSKKASQDNAAPPKYVK